MMRLTTALVMVWSAVSVTAYAQAGSQQTGTEAALRERVLAYYHAVETMSVDAAMEFWTRERTIGYASAGKVNPSVDALTSEWKTGWATRLRHTFRCQEASVRLLGPDAAMTMCIGTGRVEYKNGNISNFNYVGTMLWTRGADGWKVTLLQETSAAR